MGWFDVITDPFEEAWESITGKEDISEAEKEVGKAGRLQAERIGDETAEEVRRMELQQRELEGLTRARIGGSGVTMQGSPLSYLETMSEENRRQVEWLEESSKSRQEIARQTGEYQAQGLQAESKRAGYQTAGSIASFMAAFLLA